MVACAIEEGDEGGQRDDAMAPGPVFAYKYSASRDGHTISFTWGCMHPETHHISVRRTALYCTLGGGADVRSVWYVLHGYRQLADRFIRRFEPFASQSRVIVAPEALNRFYLDDDDGLKRHGPDSPVGATWMTRHDREAEIDDYVAYLDELDGALAMGPDVRRVVLGFSQGAATAARWSVLGAGGRGAGGAGGADRLVLWGGVLPPDLPIEAHAARLQSLRPVIACGERDPALSIERAHAEVARLAEHGIAATVMTHPGGHLVTTDAVKRLAALVEGD